MPPLAVVAIGLGPGCCELRARYLVIVAAGQLAGDSDTGVFDDDGIAVVAAAVVVATTSNKQATHCSHTAIVVVAIVMLCTTHRLRRSYMYATTSATADFRTAKHTN